MMTEWVSGFVFGIAIYAEYKIIQALIKIYNED